MYGQRWTSQFTDDIGLRLAQEQWSKMLSGFSMDQIKAGLDRCVDDHPKWPPTIGEFKQLCKTNPADFGLPSVSDAWSQLCIEGQQLSHGVVLAARNDPRCDVYNWRMLPMDKGVKAFEPIYLEYVGRCVAGEQFSLPVMLEDKQGRPVTWSERKEHASKYLSKLSEALR